MYALTAFLFATASACGDGSGHTASTTPTFVEFPWQVGAPDVRTQRLCREAAAPDDAADTTFIDCALEGASFALAHVETGDEVTVLAYNILRGFEVDDQIELLRRGDPIPVPDVLLLSEVDRGCRRTGFRNIAREYAAALGFYYVYATEFVELPGDRGLSGPYDPPLCEHGNAIVARYPLGNVRQIRHAQNRSWYTPPDFPNPDEPRLGGRIAIAADMQIGAQLIRLYSLHLESTLSALRTRDAQADEIAADAIGIDTPIIAGGDLNAFFAIFDLERGTTKDRPTQAFLQSGFFDAHENVPLTTRTTSFDPVPLIIDFIFAKRLEIVDAGLCPVAECGNLSDHLPIWATLALR